MVAYTGGAQVMVAEGRRIASIQAPTSLLFSVGGQHDSAGQTTHTSAPQIDAAGGLERCVDVETQYAPIGVPDGWNRFVLGVQPSGTCGPGPFLFMSMVVPGTEEAPGTLVTFTSLPSADVAPQPGEAIRVNDNAATLQRSVQADGASAALITMRIGGIAITGHGHVDDDTLIELMSTIGPLSDDDWGQLVAEMG